MNLRSHRAIRSAQKRAEEGEEERRIDAGTTLEMCVIPTDISTRLPCCRIWNRPPRHDSATESEGEDSQHAYIDGCDCAS